jgi:hypothetical protein
VSGCRFLGVSSVEFVTYHDSRDAINLTSSSCTLCTVCDEDSENLNIVCSGFVNSHSEIERVIESLTFHTEENYSAWYTSVCMPIIIIVCNSLCIYLFVFRCLWDFEFLAFCAVVRCYEFVFKHVLRNLNY